MPQIRIDRESKSYVLEDGTSFPIPEEYQREILKSQHGHEITQKRKQQLEEESQGGPDFLKPLQVISRKTKSGTTAGFGPAAEEFIGSLPETLKGAGPGQDKMGFYDRLIENYRSRYAGRQKFEAGEEAQHPTASKIGTGFEIAGELASTGRLPASVQFPLAALGHSDETILEPVEAVKTMAGPAAIGATLDAFFHGAGKIARNRGVQRTANEANVAEKNAVEASNLAEEQRFANQTTQEAQRIKNATQAEKQRFSTETAQAENQAQLLKETQARDIENQAMQQQAANQAFVQAGERAYEKIPAMLGKELVNADAMGVKRFVNEIIETSPLAASKEGRQVSRFLSTLFKSDAEGKISSDRIVKGLRSIDETIAKESGPIRDLLTQYKEFAFSDFPQKISNQLAFSKYAPKVMKTVEPKIEQGISSLTSQNHHIFDLIRKDLGSSYFNELKVSLKNDIKNFFESNQIAFQDAISSGKISETLSEIIKKNPEYQKLVSELESISKFRHPTTKGFKPEQIYGPAWKEVESQVVSLPETLVSKLQEPLEKINTDIYIHGLKSAEKANKLLSGLEKTPPAIPSAVETDPNRYLNMTPQPVAPFTPPTPQTIAPANIQQPNLVDVASLPESQGAFGKLASALEGLTAKNVKDQFSQIGYGQSVGYGSLAKLAGVPLKATAGNALAIGAGLKGITSPSALGEAVRAGGQKSAQIGALVYMQAQKYASFRDGILDDPMDRRSLVKEIEDNPSLSLTDKAMMQTQVNRGIPLK